MPRPTKTLIGSKARKAVWEGVNAIYRPVSLTLGPQGRNTLLYRTYNRGSRITNDGYITAEVQEPQDIFIRLAANTFKEVCKRTNERVGDGTTTTAVIAGKLFNDCYDLLEKDRSEFVLGKTGEVSVQALRRRILETALKVKEEIKMAAKKVESLADLEKVAAVSVEDGELGKIVAGMAWEVGVDGFIDVIEGYKGTIETEIIKGMRFPAKIAAKAFVNNPARYEMAAVDCPVFITDWALDNAAEFGNIFRELNKHISKVIVVAPSFSENVLVNMVNATKSGYFFYPVAVPSLRPDQFEDLAVYCNAKFFSKGKSKLIGVVNKEDLGFLEKLVLKDTEVREDAVATGGGGTIRRKYVRPEEKDGKNILKEMESDAVEERIEVLKGQLAETKQETFRKLLQRRIASMSSAVGVIRVGDTTEASASYKKLKIEDGVYASKAALRGGYVKGGGLCLKEIAEKLPDDDILKPALLAPYEQIQASFEGGTEIGEDIIDPMEAVYYSVEHAAGVVANLITVEVVTQETEDVQFGDAVEKLSHVVLEAVLAYKRHLGQLKESEEEAERDRLRGLTVDEHVYFDGQYLNE